MSSTPYRVNAPPQPRLPRSFYTKSFGIGLALGCVMEATMSLTGFYDSLRIAEGKKRYKEMVKEGEEAAARG
ncbi:hypothetical protein M427DRAFT_68871 [Gonapodya prolifera JEL478]|uniref:Uncharacterized protein n=1 Tax=Gonapodya prolifera (strain JEL478) TaxID=1344416 RepID=A0A139AJ92_GONPJ|nr:hypothetical protein M427DRAFT_68871 [Gonapodya prolifera JEL478]|eukprot:KXS16857.1 hypothetical protein M427DRAFT_68871 [Gonapodya prolifera JEL478]